MLGAAGNLFVSTDGGEVLRNIHVMLVGGRPLPNFLGILRYRPDGAIFIISEDSLGDYENWKPNLPESLNIIYEQKVKAVDYRTNLELFTKVCRQFRGEHLHFNITCSHKLLALAAYDAARQFEGTSVFYVDSATEKVVWLWPGEDRYHEDATVCVTTKQYLAVYRREARFGPLKERTFSNEAASSTARLLADGGDDAADFLNRVRRIEAKEWPQRIAVGHHGAFVTRIKELGVIDVQNGLLVIRSNQDFEFFKGGWLEFFVEREARNLRHESLALFDEVHVNLEIPSGEASREIDVACLYKSQLILVSCKTGGKAFETRHLDELSAASGLIGGHFCSRIFVTNERFSIDKRRNQFLAQAKQRCIVVVTGEDLPRIGAILRKQASDPDFPRL